MTTATLALAFPDSPWLFLWRLVSARDAVLLQGRQGKWRWPWAVLSTVLAIICIVFLLVLVLGIAGLLNVDLKDDKLLDPQRPASFFLVLFLFLPFIVVPSLLIRYLHQVSWCQVLAFSGRFDWRLYLRAAGAFFTAAAILLAIDYPIHASGYRLLPRGVDYAPWLALGLAVIFAQTLAEEILFRGYLLLAFGCGRAFPPAHHQRRDGRIHLAALPQYRLQDRFLLQSDRLRADPGRLVLCVVQDAEHGRERRLALG